MLVNPIGPTKKSISGGEEHVMMVWKRRRSKDGK
jgi:hypothetical protein